MDKETKLQEQDAPLKNTDQAFVQVSEDGSPFIPEKSEGSEERNTGNDDSPTTIERR